MPTPEAGKVAVPVITEILSGRLARLNIAPFTPNMTAQFYNHSPDLGHRLMSCAARLGACFIVSHAVTVMVTCAVEGFNWGTNAWVLDVTGFLAGIFFTVQCWLSSKTKSHEFRSGNLWIFLWASTTLIVRIIDTLMLLGWIKWSAVYITPVGSVFWSNVVSEIIFGASFTITALLGALILLRSSGREVASR